jgi:hypothetical protein
MVTPLLIVAYEHVGDRQRRLFYSPILQLAYWVSASDGLAEPDAHGIATETECNAID